MKGFFSLFLILGTLSSLAWSMDDYQSIAFDAKNRMPEQMAQYHQDAENAKLASTNITASYRESATATAKQEQEKIAYDIKLQEKPISTKKPMSSILIFVSFSMPQESLQAYLHDAKKIHASVIIRGLIDNSFKKTFQKMAELVKASGGGGVELNPLWFKRFDIQTVPAVVVVPEGSVCFKNDVCNKENDFDVMVGDITLTAALREIRDRGRLTKDIAKSALVVLQGSTYA